MIAVRSLVSFQLLDSELYSDGRYVILNASINNRNMTIANIYTPNTNQKHLYKDVMGKLEPFRQGLCGDFNQVVDLTLDSSNPTHKRSTALSSLMHSEDLCNPWRCLHNTERDYTFYSHMQKTYSRIDLFLTDKHTLQSVQETKIGLVTWSDHAPISMKLYPTHHIKKGTIWRLNTSVISRPHYQKQIASEIENYFNINMGSVSNPTVLWNAHNACIRGLLIKIGAHEKKQHNATTDHLLRPNTYS